MKEPQLRINLEGYRIPLYIKRTPPTLLYLPLPTNSNFSPIITTKRRKEKKNNTTHIL